MNASHPAKVCKCGNVLELNPGSGPLPVKFLAQTSTPGSQFRRSMLLAMRQRNSRYILSTTGVRGELSEQVLHDTTQRVWDFGFHG